MQKFFITFSLLTVCGFILVSGLCGCKSNNGNETDISKQPPANSPEGRSYIIIREGEEKGFNLNPMIGSKLSIKTKPYPMKPNTVNVTGFINNIVVFTETKEIPIGKTEVIYLQKGLTSVKIKLVKGYKVYCSVSASP